MHTESGRVLSRVLLGEVPDCSRIATAFSPAAPSSRLARATQERLALGRTHASQTREVGLGARLAIVAEHDADITGRTEGGDWTDAIAGSVRDPHLGRYRVEVQIEDLGVDFVPVVLVLVVA